MSHCRDCLERANRARRSPETGMLIVINKGRSTHVIPRLIDHETRTVPVAFFHDNDAERVDAELVFYVGGREKPFRIHLSQWDAVYVLANRLVNHSPLSNIVWIKEPKGIFPSTARLVK